MLDTAAQAIVKVVLPHDAGHARVGEDVSIARLLSLVAGERPMLLGAACSPRQCLQGPQRNHMLMSPSA